MISRKHTPGPWDFTPGELKMRTSSNIFRRGDPEFLIAHVICEGFNAAQREQDLANARLIASAPVLLAACEAAYNWLREYHTHMGDPMDEGVSGLFDQLESAMSLGPSTTGDDQQ